MIKVVELFAGVGSQHMALKKLGIKFQIVAISEIDKFAIQSYEAIHGPVNNLGDITLIDPVDVPDHDLLTYSFPCQDISNAGEQKGFDEGSGTRSSLLWQCRKVIKAKKPKYLLLENVKNLVGKKHRHNFDKWLLWLESQGYTNYWQVLNAKDYGIPQNRERVFVISILDDSQGYEFPELVELKTRLKDVLEDNVPEKYYLKTDKARELLLRIVSINDINSRKTGIDASLESPKIREVSNCISARQDRGISNMKSEGTAVIEKVGNVNPSDSGMNGNVFHEDGISPTLTTNKGEGLKILQLPAIAGSRGRNPDNYSERRAGMPTVQHLEINKDSVSNTLTTVQKDNLVIEPSGVYTNASADFQRKPMNGISRTIKATQHDAGITNGYRIRKLTPRECWRLMGFSDEDFEKAEKVVSNTQLYKQAGNSIVVDVLEAIFKNLFIPDRKPEIYQQMTLL